MVHDMIQDASYMAHGYCLLWKPWLVVLHAGSDLFIFAAYFAIPVAIWLFLRSRPDLELRPLAMLFAAFIFLCGLTHLIQVATLWWPIYETQALVKVVTAAVSVTTAIMIFPLVSTAVTIPSPHALQLVNQGLKREIAAHQQTLKRLQEARDELERRVGERTVEFETSKARLEALITASAQIMWTTDAEGRTEEDSPTWRAFTGQPYEEWRGNGWLDVVHPEDRPHALAAWKQAVASRGTYTVEYRLKHVDGDYRWTMARGVPLLAKDGTVSEWVGMNEDITPRKRSEEHASLVMRELSHRTKNLLAVIASLVRRTFEDKRDPKAQAADFIERIHGLARSHDLLVHSGWRGVSLMDLVTSHLEPFNLEPERIVIEGPPVEVKPDIAQSIGLAIHELATNATKHGALKSAHGKLKVVWSIAREDGGPTLTLEWLEDTVSSVGLQRSSGFGRIMLQQLVSASVGGTADYTLTDGRLVWRLRAPLANITAPNVAG
jgi:PAS domain S-box-containing protein